MSAFFTDAGKPRLIPNEFARPSGTVAHAVSVSSHGREPRPRVLECFYCHHGEPQDLHFVWSWLEQRFVPACRSDVWCDFRATGRA